VTALAARIAAARRAELTTATQRTAFPRPGRRRSAEPALAIRTASARVTGRALGTNTVHSPRAVRALAVAVLRTRIAHVARGAERARRRSRARRDSKATRVAQTRSVVDARGAGRVRRTAHFTAETERARFARGTNASKGRFGLGVEAIDGGPGFMDAALAFALGVQVARSGLASIGTTARAVGVERDAPTPGAAIVVRTAALVRVADAAATARVTRVVDHAIRVVSGTIRIDDAGKVECEATHQRSARDVSLGCRAIEAAHAVLVHAQEMAPVFAKEVVGRRGGAGPGRTLFRTRTSSEVKALAGVVGRRRQIRIACSGAGRASSSSSQPIAPGGASCWAVRLIRARSEAKPRNEQAQR